MADNAASFSRFSLRPANIAEFGSSVEEVLLTRGKPDRNPAASPMAAPRASEQRLFLRPTGSDQGRLGRPRAPEADPYEGPQSLLGLSRSASSKLSAPALTDLHGFVAGGGGGDAPTRELILGSFARVHALAASLAELNGMTAGVTARAVAGSRG